ncbi:MAG: SpoIIE family protein phosphatase [Anaerolineae bacterium]
MTLTRHLAQLETSGLIALAQIEPDLQYAFRHTLVQGTAYASLLAGDRQRLHEAVGQAIERLYPDRLDEYAAMLARHFHRAGDDGRAVEYYRRAGDAALASFANQEAENLFRQALALNGSDAERTGLLSGLGQALVRQDRFEEGMAVLRQAIEMSLSLGDLEAAAHLCARLGRAASNAAGPAESLRICLEGLAATAGAPERGGRARLLHETARAYYFDGDASRAEPLCRQALEMAEQHGAADVQADALATLGILPQLATEERLSALRQAAELAEAHGMLAVAARVHNNLGVQIQRAHEDPRASLRHFRQAAELHRQRGASTGVLSTTYLGVGYALLALGDLAGAAELLASMAERVQDLPDPETVQHVLDTAVAFMAAFRGELDRALERYRLAQAESLAWGDWQMLYMCDVAQADVMLAMDRQRPVESWTEVEEALHRAIAGASGGLLERAGPHCRLSAVFARQGRVDEARQALAEAERQAALDPTPASSLALRSAELELAVAEGRWAVALEAAEEIAAFHHQRGRVPYWAEAIETRAEIHLRRGQAGDAELAYVLLRQARDIYQKLGLARREAQVDEKLAELRNKAFAQARDHDTATHELAMAGRIQAGLLPEAVPAIPGWKVAATLEPARETSGDFYDFVPLPGGCLGILVADVADKGAGAALYMALTRTLLRSSAAMYPEEPGRVLATVNERILAETHTDMFVTVFYGVLNPETGTFVYANGGHNPGYLFRAGDARPLAGTGMALGVVPDAAWHQEAAHLDAGDTLLLYTDGAIDARALDGQPFGLEQLLATAQAQLSGCPAEMQAAILDEIHGFVGDAPRFDDLTLLLVART